MPLDLDRENAYPSAEWSGGLLQDVNGGQWWHMSVGTKSAVFRPVCGTKQEMRFAFDTRDSEGLDECCEWLEGKRRWLWAELRDIAGTTRPRHDKKVEWVSIVDKARQAKVTLDDLSSDLLPTGPSKEQKRIPVTVLRRFYDSLRMLNTSHLHRAIAEYFGESKREHRADNLADLWSSSLKHLRTTGYDNREESLTGRCCDDQMAVTATNDWARRVVERACPEGMRIDSCKLEYVSYEVAPLRTTRAVFEDGISGRRSGCGGIDLLLRTSTGVPVVGEIKAHTDVGPFLALIQSLTYAVELIPEPQCCRRISDVPGSECLVLDMNGESIGGVEILLILENTEQDANELDHVKEIASRLLSRRKYELSNLHKITACQVDHESLEAGEGPLVAKEIWSFENHLGYSGSQVPS